MYIRKEYNLCVSCVGWSGWTSSIDQLLRLFETSYAGRIVWFKDVILELCYSQEEDNMKTEINQKFQERWMSHYSLLVKYYHAHLRNLIITSFHQNYFINNTSLS